jgi:plasmid stabilization system protein ParE
VARVEISRRALSDLDRLIRTHSLPLDTRERVHRSLGPLESFPLIGPELDEPWTDLRFILGPWRWLVAVYEVLEDDHVVVVTFQDSRAGKI